MGKKFLKLLDVECGEWKIRGEMKNKTTIVSAKVTLKNGDCIFPKMGEELISLDEQVPSFTEPGETTRQALAARDLDITHVAEISVMFEEDGDVEVKTEKNTLC